MSFDEILNLSFPSLRAFVIPTITVSNLMPLEVCVWGVKTASGNLWVKENFAMNNAIAMSVLQIIHSHLEKVYFFDKNCRTLIINIEKGLQVLKHQKKRKIQPKT